MYSNKSIYIGKMEDGYNEGKGKLHLTNGDYFEGQFTNNALTYGQYYFSEKEELYEGDFSDNQFVG
jgi:hypothetical protein